MTKACNYIHVLRRSERIGLKTARYENYQILMLVRSNNGIYCLCEAIIQDNCFDIS